MTYFDIYVLFKRLKIILIYTNVLVVEHCGANAEATSPNPGSVYCALDEN